MDENWKHCVTYAMGEVCEPVQATGLLKNSMCSIVGYVVSRYSGACSIGIGSKVSVIEMLV